MPRDVSLSDSKCWNGGRMNGLNATHGTCSCMVLRGPISEAGLHWEIRDRVASKIFFFDRGVSSVGDSLSIEKLGRSFLKTT